jgi:hypothetical protein
MLTIDINEEGTLGGLIKRVGNSHTKLFCQLIIREGKSQNKLFCHKDSLARMQYSF